MLASSKAEKYGKAIPSSLEAHLPSPLRWKAAHSVLALTLSLSCQATEPGSEASGTAALETTRQVLAEHIEQSGAEVGLYYRSLSPGGDSIVLNGDLRMHAASTMKVPVMMQLYLDHEAGVLSLNDTLLVKTEFASIVDGSPYNLPRESDSDTTFYDLVGGQATVRHTMERMITWSSNLATNLLIEIAEPDRINATLRQLGADSIRVLRGVEDLKAFEAGLSNTTTARDLGTIMAAVVEGPQFDASSREEMLAILERQHFRENIPAGLPPRTRVANKTGWITGINHDAAAVFPDADPPYVLVILIRGHPAEDQGEALAASLSEIVWEFHTGDAP